MKLLLIRHASAEGQAADAPLSDRGQAQAVALVQPLKDLGAGPLYSSPYARAKQTLEPYSKASAREITLVDGLRERRMTAPTPEYGLAHLRRCFDNPDLITPGGESLNDIRARVNMALRLITERGGPLPAVATHGGPTAALFSSMDPDFGFDDWQALRNPDLFELICEGGALIAFSRIPLKEQVT